MKPLIQKLVEAIGPSGYETQVRELVMEEVTGLEVTGDGITVTSLFKDPHTVTGVRIHKIDFMANTVTLVPAGD